MSHLLDTDICSHLIKVGPLAALVRLEQIKEGSAHMSAVTWGELLFGCGLRPEAVALSARVRAFAEVVEPLSLDREVADHYADIRCHLQRKGTPIGSNDMWIAAHARSNNLVMVTHNTREFERVPGLKLEDWLST